MKDFSLLYGRSRSWLAVFATLAAAFGLGMLARGSSDTVDTCRPPCATQEIRADLGARRSSAAFDIAPAAPVGGDLPSSIWLQASESARDVPIVPLKPSPEPMTDAGKAIKPRQATTPVTQPPDPDNDPGADERPADTPADGQEPVADTEPAQAPPEDPAEGDGPQAEPEPQPGRAVPDDCNVRGAPLELLYIAFENYCGSSPRVCGSVEDEWYCEIAPDGQ